MNEVTRESQLEGVLMEWLVLRRRIRYDTIILREFRWFSRWIDLVTLTVSGRLTAYELKLGNNKRAIEQASYNRLAFDQSYVVTATTPKNGNALHAKQAGVGVIVVSPEKTNILCGPKQGAEVQFLRTRLLEAVRSQAGQDVR